MSANRNRTEIDFERLGPREFENFFVELLLLLGFERPEWSKREKEIGIDLTAELPRKDPDGTRYRDLWLISLREKAPPWMLIDELMFSRRFRDKVRLDRPDPEAHPAGLSTTAITVLFVSIHRPETELRARLAGRWEKMGPENLGVRARVWDAHELRRLARKHPSLVDKYFSDSARALAQYRQTPEQLYEENANLNQRLKQLLAELEAERDLRSRAERDAVWKDISVAAAHKLGNPIFAIETSLVSLMKRIQDGRAGDLEEIAARMQSAVEKAKNILAQFKSLAQAQEIRPEPLRIGSLLEDSSTVAREQGVSVRVDCDPELELVGDPRRLSEVFDELVANSLLWFDKPERVIRMSAVAIPETNRVRIHFQDNGPGIAAEWKSRIFDAFVTSHPHGTGLGLALVRRIIEGHGGEIAEVGQPGQGADFLIFLPREMSSSPQMGSESR